MGTEVVPSTLTVYLGHKYEARPLGEEVQRDLEALGLRVLNPFHRPEQETYDRVAKEDGNFAPYAEAIVTKDLAQLDQADAMVGILSPNAIGTVCEMFYAAHVRKIPVFLWVTYQMPYVHPWISFYSKAVSTKEELLEAVEDWRRRG